MDGQVGILTEAFLDIVRASENPEQARIGFGFVVNALDYHSHSATDALESCWCSQGHEIVRRRDRLGLCREVDRCPRKQGGKALAGKIDVNSIGMDCYSARECHQRCLGLVWSVQGGERLREGLDFRDSEQPDYWDFFYFATSFGAASQTSDVTIRTKALRRLATLHAVISFFFNAAVLALAVNIGAGLMSSVPPR